MRSLPVPCVLRAAVVAAVVALSACDNPMGPDDDLEEARQKWSRQGFDSYRFTVSQLCFCGPDVRGTFRVVIQRGQVASVTDAQTGEPRTPHPAVPLTVEALFQKIEDAIDEDADEIDVRYDPALGYPQEIAIDFIENAIDDEVTYTASDLAPIR